MKTRIATPTAQSTERPSVLDDYTAGLRTMVRLFSLTLALVLFHSCVHSATGQGVRECDCQSLGQRSNLVRVQVRGRASLRTYRRCGLST